MVMLSILGFFLTVLWFILPFVIFAMKGKLDRVCELLENLDSRLSVLETQRATPDPLLPEVSAGGGEPDNLPVDMPPPSAG
jgi:hypothetical protein